MWWERIGDLVDVCISLILERVEDEVQEDVELLLPRAAIEAASASLGSSCVVVESCQSWMLPALDDASKETVLLGTDSGMCLRQQTLSPIWAAVHP